MERGELCSSVPGRQCFIDAVKLVSVVTPGQEVLLAGSPGEIKGQKKAATTSRPGKLQYITFYS